MILSCKVAGQSPLYLEGMGRIGCMGKVGHSMTRASTIIKVGGNDEGFFYESIAIHQRMCPPWLCWYRLTFLVDDRMSFGNTL